MRTGQLSGVELQHRADRLPSWAPSVLAQYAPHPMRTPYAACCGDLRHRRRRYHRAARTTPARSPADRIRIVRPAVPAAHSFSDFWFSAPRRDGIVVGSRAYCYSLYPTLAAQQAQDPQRGVRRRRGRNDGIRGGGGAMVAGARGAARRAAIIGDVGMASRRCARSRFPLWTDAQLAAGARSPPHLLGATFGARLRGFTAAPVQRARLADRRGETMSAFYLLGLHGDGSAHHSSPGGQLRQWPLSAVFPVVRRAPLPPACLASGSVVGAINTPARHAAQRREPRRLSGRGCHAVDVVDALHVAHHVRARDPDAWDRPSRR